MSQQLRRIYSAGDGAFAELIWDDVTMTTSGVHVIVPQGSKQRVVNATIGDQSISLTYDPGTDTVFEFPVPLAISLVQTPRGTRGMVIAGFESFGVATGD